jgi:Ni/Co efflux regulator RcnB
MAPFVAILFLAAVFASGCVIHDHGRGHGHYAGPVAVQPRVAVAVPAPITFTFTDHHRHTVQDYYHHHPRHHGNKHKWKKKKKHSGGGHLPPGLARRDVLPPGIQIQAVHGDLARQLPHPPHGTRFVYHDDQVLLIDVQTRVVLDFINISVGF